MRHERIREKLYKTLPWICFGIVLLLSYRQGVEHISAQQKVYNLSIENRRLILINKQILESRTPLFQEILKKLNEVRVAQELPPIESPNL